MASILTRYGYSESVSDPNDAWITTRLIAELRTEQFDEPDDEHTQVAVGNEHCAVTAQVSGLITLDLFNWPEECWPEEYWPEKHWPEEKQSGVPKKRHLRDIPDAELVEIWQAVVRGDYKALLDMPWKTFEGLPPYSGVDFYRTTGNLFRPSTD